MSDAIVLMTCLIPTVGHNQLISFASNLVGSSGNVQVIVNSTSYEPSNGRARAESLHQAFHSTNVIIHHLYQDTPQNPEDHHNFWNYWANIVKRYISPKQSDYFVASEPYGLNMANALNCKFIPYDINREVLQVKGTAVRNNLFEQFHNVLPEYQHNLKKTVTLFGAESCGKTTMAKRLAKDLNGYFVPEWARGYLETIGPEVTDSKMLDIVEGQYALQKSINSLKDKAWIFQDSDLLSTLGYFKLYGGYKRVDLSELHNKIENTFSDLYIVMNDQIPFEKDILRYGDGIRESNTKFWIDILVLFDCKYIEVPYMNHEEQTGWIKQYLETWYDQETDNIRNYVRK